MIDFKAIRREEFPITRRGIDLDNATLGPPPARPVRAVTAFLQRTTCAVRESRVRLSPHFYNTEQEIDSLLSCI